MHFMIRIMYFILYRAIAINSTQFFSCLILFSMNSVITIFVNIHLMAHGINILRAYARNMQYVRAYALKI